MLLLAVSVEDKVVGERLVLAQHDLRLAGAAERADSAHVDLLAGILGADPTEDGGGEGREKTEECVKQRMKQDRGMCELKRGNREERV